MGSSNKKKKEKKKDFQKAKLKVGKAKAKAASFTDTSFKSKSITVNQQSLSHASLPFPDQFKQHLSLCISAKSDSARRDALAYITNHISSPGHGVGIPQILTKLLPLLTDTSVPVRTQLLKLLSSLPPTSIPPHVIQILLYIRSGLTHLSPSVRLTALSALEWLLSAAGPATVSCAGGWLKTLTSFSSMMGWNPSVSTAMATKGWSVGIKPVLLGKHNTKKGEPEAKARQLEVLAKFIAEGLKEEVVESEFEEEAYRNNLYRLPTTPNPFAYLNLFGIPRDEENEMYLDRESRLRVFDAKWRAVIEKGKEDARKEGGAVGRAAAALHRALNGGIVVVREEETEDEGEDEEEEEDDEMDED
ncbi:putative Pre-rRNA-processing protein ipi-1 [Podospora fimiseda]|uniref:Pre-rRNA-processing protein n=1 Tax=Podospora fimiseda TaxID=252190 RepID=A0AAN7H3A3_9PEZI|nr:putative Pre-rRNA-processing protein ipi-1 [Podospora fimiseda]